MIDLTSGRIFKNLIAFATPYCLACFLQTFYGLADLFIIGQFNGPSAITAVSIGSQIMHLVILLLAGLAMGATVEVGRAVGAKDLPRQAQVIGNAWTLLLLVSLTGLIIGLFSLKSVASILQTPPEAFDETLIYSSICLLGMPLIAVYDVISSSFRGFGNSRQPMFCVAIGGAVNILLDYIFIGLCRLGVAGAAWATLCGQAVSVVAAVLFFRPYKNQIAITWRHLKIIKEILHQQLLVGIPTAAQDVIIQLAFLFITMIANTRGLYVAASVGIVEKIICFFFLVPSAMLAAVSAICSQNRGAGQHGRARLTLRYGIYTVIGYGLLIGILCQFSAPQIIAAFKDDLAIITYGSQYLRPYSFDALLAGIHFCFSGYFCAYHKAGWAFIHNFISSVFIRVPGTWLMATLFPATLVPMGMVAPLGSIISIIICFLVYRHFFFNKKIA